MLILMPTTWLNMTFALYIFHWSGCYHVLSCTETAIRSVIETGRSGATIPFDAIHQKEYQKLKNELLRRKPFSFLPVFFLFLMS